MQLQPRWLAAHLQRGYPRFQCKGLVMGCQGLRCTAESYFFTSLREGLHMKRLPVCVHG